MKQATVDWVFLGVELTVQKIPKAEVDMKKFIPVLLVVISIMSVFSAGCGSKPTGFKKDDDFTKP